MLISYTRRHGLRHTLLAMYNTLTLFGLFVLLGGLAMLGANRGFYEGLASQTGHSVTPLFGSWFASVMLHPATVWAMLVCALAVFGKEFLMGSLAKRLVVNTALLLVGMAGSAYLVYVLHIVPMGRGTMAGSPPTGARDHA